MNKKLLILISLILICVAQSFAQIEVLVDNFKTAYSSGNINEFLKQSEYLVSNLKSPEKSKSERIITLFKVLTNKEQSMGILDFNYAMKDVGLNYSVQKEMNSGLSFILVKYGDYGSSLVLNKSKNMYKFTLNGTARVANKMHSNTFNGGVFEYHCRGINYGKVLYSYIVKSIEEIPSL